MNHNRICKIKCDDYNKGPFIPESFEPKLIWTITESYFEEHPNPKGLPKYIKIVAYVGDSKLCVYSHPYSYGQFTASGYNWGFGGKAFWLDTNDPEEAIYITEHKLFDWADTKRWYYEQIADLVNPY